MLKMTAKELMQLSPIVPVISLDEVEDALPLAKALLEGGINIMEVTLRTKAALKSIESIAHALPEMHVGAGTVLNARDFKMAVEYGASFIFSPGISEELMLTSKELDVVLIPGVATASEVMLAKNNGFEGCKLYPAALAGGVDILKAFGGPFPSISFCPTGGVNLTNLNAFLNLKNVLCVGGSWIIPDEMLKAKNFEGITNLTKEALAAVKSV
ncbi:MAG: 4-Hydroxy-2-oxoglutarate aldolase (EC @ 2-dehydro-3-deoxyphosphogluconate aldolase (EC [uncultured Sulfurovum sp.]|uniref:2-dehydro-3-deoxy-phosphogluconate aldolase n=1 Tax=uncultured Sulfurovum sp. TaxID=269237 RepID=A0A6S6S2D7_9BACT|nr:MAG: 4-Hydroxy-2-oxoglutarate aldolase (EC @ 2-dehydro-3-deoxyphosphogluconate aldolase (EC [uncultured Sulfurovum sp.]